MENGRREKLVAVAIREARNFVVGGYENAILDGYAEEMPNDETLVFEIYDEVLHNPVVELRGGLVPIKKDIRFLGKDRIHEMIRERL